jgi:CBS domain-containing protein
MKISEITTRNAPTIGPDSTLREAALAMRSAETGILPVAKDGRLVGTLSERDLVVKGCCTGADPTRDTVAALFNRAPIICPGDESLKAALELMRERKETWLVVLDRDGAVSGVVSLVELLDVLESLVPEETDGPLPDYVWRVRGGEDADT